MIKKEPKEYDKAFVKNEKFLTSMVVQTAFNNLGLDIENFLNNKEKPKVFYANLDYSISGITVFGGTILINFSLSENTKVLNCARLITYLHELSHLLQRSVKGFYDINQFTPIKDIECFQGCPGSEEVDSDGRAKHEGGIQLKHEIFGPFFNRANMAQIEFINNAWNWRLSPEEFKNTLKKLYSKDSVTYQLSRNSYIIDLHRACHKFNN